MNNMDLTIVCPAIHLSILCDYGSQNIIQICINQMRSPERKTCCDPNTQCNKRCQSLVFIWIVKVRKLVLCFYTCTLALIVGAGYGKRLIQQIPDASTSEFAAFL